MAALSWDRIVERGKQQNKTVLCEVEKRGRHRYFLIKCSLCGSEKEERISRFFSCFKCFCKKITNDDDYFISKSKKVHGNKYNYDFVEYVQSKTKVKILCNKCNNIFEQRPANHMRGDGCRNCYNEKLRYKYDYFISKSKKVHGNKYNYDFVEYKGHECKVNILCNKCNNIFEQRPSRHMKGFGCQICVNREITTKNTKSVCEFTNNSKKVHGNKYNYDFVEYVNSSTKVKILCNNCNNIFEQIPHNHTKGHGCSKCIESKGENRVAKYLTENNINFTPQKIFKTLRYKSYLKPDFYLEDFNLLIEYDGEFHFKALIGLTHEIKQKNLEVQQQRDKIKNEWAKANNIPLLRIPYWDYDRIEELIEAFIIQHTKKKEIKQLVLEM